MTMKKIILGLTVLSAFIAAPSQAQTPSPAQLQSMAKKLSELQTVFEIDKKCHNLSKPALEILLEKKKNLKQSIIAANNQFENELNNGNAQISTFINSKTCAEATGFPLVKSISDKFQMSARIILFGWEKFQNRVTIDNSGFYRNYTYKGQDFKCPAMAVFKIGEVIEYHKPTIDALKANSQATLINKYADGVADGISLYCIGQHDDIGRTTGGIVSANHLFKVFNTYQQEWKTH